MSLAALIRCSTVGAFALLTSLCVAALAPASDRLEWRSQDNRISADFKSARVLAVLEEIALATGWQVYLEPGTEYTVSTKFKDRTVGEALQLLLGNLSYVRVPPDANAPAKLYVFRTSRTEATQLIKPVLRKQDPTAKPIPNELIVKLKKGANIDELAKKLGAKVIGRAEAADTYRLSFDTPEAAQAAREQLENSPEVEAIDSNYYVRRPEASDGLNFSPNSNFDLKPRPSGDCSGPIIGLIDTAIQPTGTAMDAFLLPSISVAGQSQFGDGQPTHATAMAETALQALSNNTQPPSGQNQPSEAPPADKQTGARVLPVDVYGPNATTTTFDVAHGIVEAINKGANIINMSLGGGGHSDFLHGVIKQGTKQGVLFLAAAGNEPTTAPTYPAAYPEVLAVTARTRDGGIAPYANRGDFIDLSAPGSSIFPFQGQSWMATGTSGATAFASGLAASLWDCNKMTSGQIAGALQQLMPVKR